MREEAIKSAISEAKRFVKLASEITYWESNDGAFRSVNSNPKLTGAMRRASLDLTRALAEMRKP